MGSYAAAAEVLGYRLQVTGSFQFSVPCRSKGAKWAKLGGQGGQVRKVEEHIDFGPCC